MNVKRIKAQWSAREQGMGRHFRTSMEDSMIVVRGREEATVHGCERIIEYSPEQIRLKMRHFVLCLVGECLCCTSFSGGCVTVEGKIGAVCYEAVKKEALL